MYLVRLSRIIPRTKYAIPAGTALEITGRGI
jgi:hypothetical protein